MSLITRTDVTAVKLYENCIFAGIGSWINIFDRSSAKLTQKLHALNGQKIYGFVPSVKEEIFVFGGKQFTVIRKQSGNQFIKLFDAIVCNDWLQSAAWTTDGSITLLTAHNVVQLWNTSTLSKASEHVSKDNSILYSGLLQPIEGDVLVFCGTVFSEVLIHRCHSDTVLYRLKGHKGVIFSVSCNLQRCVVVTTSDDRSVRIWRLQSTVMTPDTIEFWENVKIDCIHELYGHLARVMRSCIREEFIISIGEDSCVCFWGYDGTLLKKITTHQSGCIWSLDADGEYLVTGGGDSGIVLHPLAMLNEYAQNVNIEVAHAKKLVFTARRNIVIMSETDDLIYYDVTTKLATNYQLKHESTYKLLSISSCKQIIAIVDMFGNLDIFTEACKGLSSIRNFISTKLQIGKILFMQWVGNRHLVFSSENGAVTVLASRDDKTEIFANFILPPCKERWLTAAAINTGNNMLVVGDRCGTVHVYIVSQKNPLKSFKKVHGRYGPTSIYLRKNEIVTTGRDGTVKYFSINKFDVKLKRSQNLEFQWVERFVDKNGQYICGFHERMFVVHDISNNNKLIEVLCGGGHRSWDIIRYIKGVDGNYDEFIKLIYLKNSNVKIESFQLSKVVSRNIINGTHSKEINCLKTYSCDQNTSTVFVISGGEDTSLRISSIRSYSDFQGEAIFKQLSSIKTLKLCSLEKNKVLLISAGGRAQICIKSIEFHEDDGKINVETEELCDYLIKGTDKERKGNQTWLNCNVDIDPETRIMDLDVFKSDDNNLIIVAGCSDAYLRVFNFKYDDNNSILKPIKELKHHDTCILKTQVFDFQNKKILISGTTRGVSTFWEVEKTNSIENIDIRPIKSINLHQSGINSIACSVISNETVLIASGGDDNTVNLNLIDVKDSETSVRHSWSNNKLHCSQITGIMFVDEYVVSTSIDQRVTLLRWEAGREVKCEFVSQVFSDVADIQGLDVLKHDRIKDSKRACSTTYPLPPMTPETNIERDKSYPKPATDALLSPRTKVVASKKVKLAAQNSLQTKHSY